MNDDLHDEGFRGYSGPNVCEAREGKHLCDLDNRHTSRHMCWCGRFFDGDA